MTTAFEDTGPPRQQTERVTRVVDFRVPLQYLAPVTAAMIWGLVSMWFGVQQLNKEMNDLQVTIKASIAASAALTSEIALIKFRLDNIENDRARQGGPGLSPPRR